MRKIFFPLVLIVLLFATCSNEQPTPLHPITISEIPRDTTEVAGQWKMGKFTIGYRITTDNYVIISEYGGLFGQDGLAFAGPGLVPHMIIKTFEPIAILAKKAQNKEVMTFSGDLVYAKNGKPYLYLGKQVILLFTAEYLGHQLEVNRRPWAN